MNLDGTMNHEVPAGAFGAPTPPGTTITAQRSAQVTRAYVAAFFDLHLKGIAQPLPDGPSAGFPEVGFHS